MTNIRGKSGEISNERHGHKKDIFKYKVLNGKRKETYQKMWAGHVSGGEWYRFKKKEEERNIQSMKKLKNKQERNERKIVSWPGGGGVREGKWKKKIEFIWGMRKRRQKKRKTIKERNKENVKKKVKKVLNRKERKRKE